MEVLIIIGSALFALGTFVAGVVVGARRPTTTSTRLSEVVAEYGVS